MSTHAPVPPIVDGATPLAQSRMARLYDALCHAPSGGLDTRALSDRTGIALRTAYGLLKRLEDNELVWSSLEYSLAGSGARTVRMWRRVGAP